MTAPESVSCPACGHPIWATDLAVDLGLIFQGLDAIEPVDERELGGEA